ncbi:MAG: uroporphyrinogen decarboxylase family protein [Spirochaetes bacterium]|nr:uroporphyrinogen decarboxylase family protein [Spirochaetota bacterium]
MTKKEIVIDLLKEKTRTRSPVMPITMMFAADQTGSPYVEYAKDYRVLVEAQMATAEKFGFDHVSVISDPAREAADFGAMIHYFPDQPPAVDESNAFFTDKKRLAGLKLPDPLAGGRMHDRIQGVALFKQKTGDNILIEGWLEGPCAEAADLRGINNIMTDFFDDPGFITDLFELVVANAVNFAKYQIEAGADIIGVGDAAASLVGPQIYEEFVYPYEKRLIDQIHAMGGMVRLHICGNIADSLVQIGKLGAEIVDVDSMVTMKHARKKTGINQVLLGNVNPVTVVKNGTPDLIYAALQQCADEAGPNYIVGAGCEIPRGTSDENVKTFAKFAHHEKNTRYN